MEVFGVYWVSEVADFGLLPVLVGMGDLWISGLPCVGWCSGHLSGGRTVYVMYSGAPLCLSFVGFCLWLWLRLVGRWRPRALGFPLCISGDGVLVLVCLCCLLGTWVS